jgi:Arc/MetJ family transcription regulator
MKTPTHSSNIVHMPPELLAEARRVADEEHRPADELVSDAVRRYLESRRAQERNEHAQEATGATDSKRTLLDLFKPLRGLDVEFSRNPSTGRPVDL